MRPRTRWTAFALLAAVGLAVSQAAWPFVRGAFTEWICAVSSTLLSLTWVTAVVDVAAHACTSCAPGRVCLSDAELRLCIDQHEFGNVVWSAYLTAYVPTSIAIGLGAAGLASRLHGWKVLLGSAALAHAYVCVRLALMAGKLVSAHARICDQPEWHSPLVGTDGFASGFRLALDIVHVEPTIYVLVPVACWLTLALPARTGPLRAIARN